MLLYYSVENALAKCQMVKIQSPHCYCTSDDFANCTYRHFSLPTQVQAMHILKIFSGGAKTEKGPSFHKNIKVDEYVV